MRRINSLMIALALASLCQTGFAQTSTFTTVSAGNWGPVVAPDSIAAGFGSSLSAQTYSALSVPLPSTLGGVSIQLTDSAKATNPAGLFMASQGQVNYAIPAGAAVGMGTANAVSNGGSRTTGTVLISNVAPALFAANENGQGVAAGQIFYYPASGGSSYYYTFSGGSGGYVTSALSLSPSSGQAFLILYGTGFRHHSPNPVEATIGGVKVPVTYAGAVSGYVGLDQINLGPLPQSLAGTGKGDVNVAVFFDGVPANTVTVNFQ